MMEQVVSSVAAVESMLLRCTKQLLELLDRVDDASIEEIVEIISGLSRDEDRDSDPEKLKSKEVTHG